MWQNFISLSVKGHEWETIQYCLFRRVSGWSEDSCCYTLAICSDSSCSSSFNSATPPVFITSNLTRERGGYVAISPQASAPVSPIFFSQVTCKKHRRLPFNFKKDWEDYHHNGVYNGCFWWHHGAMYKRWTKHWNSLEERCSKRMPHHKQTDASLWNGRT